MLRTVSLLLLFIAACEASNSTDDAWCCNGTTSVMPWLSHVLLGLGVFTFIVGGLPLLLDGAANCAQLGALDEELKGMNKAKAYEAFNNSNDPVIRHLGFWCMVMMRSWGCFQVTLGIGLYCVIGLVPIQHRAAAHFTYGFLDLSVGFVEANTGMGLPFGVDVVKKFGGGGKVAPEASGGMPRPKMVASFCIHMTLACFNLALALGVLFLD